jgi:hypothetical protein
VGRVLEFDVDDEGLTAEELVQLGEPKNTVEDPVQL